MFTIERRMAFVGAILALAVIVAGFFAYQAWQHARTAKTEATLSKNQTGAAIESGKDAANTIANRADTDAEADRITRENATAIGNAPGATVTVSPEVAAAGRAALCRRAAYKDTLGCKDVK